MAIKGGARRRRREGSVLVEALIVIPVLIACMAGACYVYVRGADTLDLLYAARQEAWTHTIDGCGPPSWDFQAILSNRVVGVLQASSPVGVTNLLLRPPTDESWWESAMQLVVELLHGEDVYIAPSEPPAQTEGITASATAPEQAASLQVLMGCNERPHDLGTRRSWVQWARELIFN